VRVDERGQRDEALAVDRLGALGRVERARLAELGDRAAADQDVAGAVDPRARVEQARLADEDVAGRGRLEVELRRAHAGCGSVVASGRAKRVEAWPPPPPASSS
jgi:hypothetical protein